MSPERIKVAFVLPHFRAGGAERVVLNWIGALDRTRFEPFLFLGKVDGAFLAELPADVTPIAIGGGRALLRPLRIARLLKAHGVAVAYSATNAMNLALLSAPAGGVVKIVSEHTMSHAYLATAKWRKFRLWQMRRLYPRADVIAVPTDAIGAQLQTLIGTPLALQTLPNPVVSSVSAPSAPRSGSGRVVSAGRLVREKGYDILIEACAQLAGTGALQSLIIYGDGPLRGTLQEQINALGLGDCIRLAGHVADLGPGLEAADLFVLASRREGFGNVLVEAMAAGVPVLATRCGGPDSFIRHGENGWLVAPDDPQALGDMMTTLMVDPHTRQSTVTAACETARAYDVKLSTQKLERLLLAMVTSPT